MNPQNEFILYSNVFTQAIMSSVYYTKMEKCHQILVRFYWIFQMIFFLQNDFSHLLFISTQIGRSHFGAGRPRRKGFYLQFLKQFLIRFYFMTTQSEAVSFFMDKILLSRIFCFFSRTSKETYFQNILRLLYSQSSGQWQIIFSLPIFVVLCNSKRPVNGLTLGSETIIRCTINL